MRADGLHESVPLRLLRVGGAELGPIEGELPINALEGVHRMLGAICRCIICIIRPTSPPIIPATPPCWLPG
jgi:hypothetical protein